MEKKDDERRRESTRNISGKEGRLASMIGKRHEEGKEKIH